MPSYAVFLRAINVGGRRLTNDRLRAELEALGCADVRPIQAAGTAVLTSGRRSAAALGGHLSDGLEAALGHEATAFVRTAGQVHAIVTADPFGGAGTPRAEGAKVHVTFLPDAPTAARRRAVEALGVPGDELAVIGAELHWHRAGKMMDSALDQKALAAALGNVPTTTRTLATVVKVAAALDALP